MQVFEAADGARLAYRDTGTNGGTGLPLLALAGLTRDGRDFDYLAPHLPRDVRLIRLDSRGRGGSDWTGAESYTIAQESADALALLDHLGLERVALLGSSRGGLIGMVIAATAPGRLAGLCLNDVGPRLERAGLERIGQTLGRPPVDAPLSDLAAGLAAAMPGFADVPPRRWQEEAERHLIRPDGRAGLSYDPALRTGFEAAMAAPLPEMWELFAACAGLPMALIRGAGSDVLSAETAAEMARRHPGMTLATLPGRGHIPFLDEPEALACIDDWLAEVRAGMA